MADAAPHGEHRIAGPRLIAIVGPFQSGKTSLLEGLLARGGGVARQGAVREGTTVGDSCPEARAHQMSVEPNIAHVDYMGDRITFFDCPGSVEFFARHARRAAGLRRRGGGVRGRPAQGAAAAGDPARARGDEDPAPVCSSTRSISPAAACARRWRCCSRPRARRCCCARFRCGKSGVATGFVDLALERAFVYREAAPSEVVEMPAGVGADEKQARYSMLERLADYDDELMEQLLNDIEPPRDKVFDDLARELREGHVVPLLIGSATQRPRRDPAPEGAAPRGPRHRRDARAARRRRPRGRRSPRSCAPSTPRTAAS